MWRKKEKNDTRLPQTSDLLRNEILATKAAWCEACVPALRGTALFDTLINYLEISKF